MTAPTRPRPGLAALATLLLDVAAPVALYYVLRAQGVGDVVALAAGALPPVAHALVSWIRTRRPDPIALAVLATVVIGLVVALISGDVRSLLVRGAWLSGGFGLWTLATLWARRPFCFEATRAVLPHRAALMDELWDTEPRFRRAFRHITIAWGVVTLVDCGLRVLMATLLPVAAVPALDTTLTIVTVVVMQVPTHVLLHRAGVWDAMFRPASQGEGRQQRAEPALDRRDEARPIGLE